jgi:hypothetical protein
MDLTHRRPAQPQSEAQAQAQSQDQMPPMLDSDPAKPGQMAHATNIGGVSLWA